jgi:6-phosphogluconolactonase
MKPEKRIFENQERLIEAMAEQVAALIQETVQRQDRCTIALSGGHTPRRLYGLLASTYRAIIPWQKIHLFWGDERYVTPEDHNSNYRMAKEALLDHIPIPRDHIHPMPTLLPEPEEAAEEYEQVIMAHFNQRWPRFDLVLLGMGVDGHIASLFPRHAALEEEAKIVRAVRTEGTPPVRLTLTLPAINHAANIHFLVTGREKSPAVKLAFMKSVEVHISPASGVKPEEGKLVWWLDEGAAALL